MANPENDRKPKNLSLELSDEVLSAEHQPSHDQKWAALGPTEAPFIRHALMRAREIREEGLDAGDAYLQGVADMHHDSERRELVESVRSTLAVLPEIPEVDPPA